MPPSPEDEQETGAPDGTAKHHWLSTVLPANRAVCAGIRHLLGDQKVQVRELVDLISQDLVIMIELLSKANCVANTSRGNIKAARVGVLTLGIDKVTRIVDSLLERPSLPEGDLADRVEQVRLNAQRTGVVTSILANVIVPGQGDEALTVGLLTGTGELVAALYLRERYSVIIEQFERKTQIRYRLAQDCGFDLDHVGTEYLRAQGIPMSMVELLDREKPVSNPKQSALRFCTLSAQEMVESFDEGKWENLAPGKKIPPKSAIRMLQLEEAQYEKLYARIDDFFSAGVIDDEAANAVVDEVLTHQGVNLAVPAEQVPVATPPPAEPSLATPQSAPESVVAAPVPPPAVESAAEVGPSDEMVEIESVIEIEDDSLAPMLITGVKGSPLVPPPDLLPRRPSRVAEAQAEIDDIWANFQADDDVEGQLLKFLVGQGFFYRAAILNMTPERNEARVVDGVGDGVIKGVDVPWGVLIEPGTQMRHKVNVFGLRQAPHCPFGSNAFALSFLGSRGGKPIVIYSDCGKSLVVPFESRRVFRSVVRRLHARFI